MKYQEIEGDLIKLALEGKFDVITHGCNCQCTMSSGLAPQMAKAFYCNKFPLENKSNKGDINKLGQIDWKLALINDKKVATIYKPNPTNATQLFYKQHLIVINAYTQFMYGTNHVDGISKPLDYEALTLCLRKINHIFKGKHIGLPLIGCHLAGGVWDYHKLPKTSDEEIEIYEQFYHQEKKDVKTIIQEELKDCKVTVVHYKP